MPDTDTKEKPELSAELQKQLTEVHNALETLKNSSDPETIKRVEEFMHKHETLSQEHASKMKAYEEANAKALEAAEAKADDAVGRCKELETLLSQKGDAEADPRQEKNYLAFYDFLTHGNIDRVERDYGEEVVKTLRTDNNVEGGVLAPGATDTEIRKNIVEISPMRAICSVRMAPVKSLEIWRRAGEPRAKWKGEMEAAEDTQSKYVSETLTPHALTAQTAISNDMLKFAAVDMEQQIVMDISEEFARGENYAYVKGTGIKMPLGIDEDSRIEHKSTAGSGTIDFDDVADLVGLLKYGYNPMYTFSRQTLTELWKLRSSAGEPIWQPISGEGGPAHIWGFPYSSAFQDLDNAGAGSGASPIYFGDFKAGYEILDAQGIEAIRDIYSKKAERAIEWVFHKYSDGRVVKPEAIKGLTIS